MIKYLAIIPARKNSKRLKKKGIRFFLGHNKKNISNPDSFDIGKRNQLYIEKDRTGCGCVNTRIVKENRTDTKDKIIEKYIPGQSYSISLHISHKSYNIMSINKQITQKINNSIKLKALLVNIYPSFRDHLFHFIDNILNKINYDE